MQMYMYTYPRDPSHNHRSLGGDKICPIFFSSVQCKCAYFCEIVHNGTACIIQLCWLNHFGTNFLDRSEMFTTR